MTTYAIKVLANLLTRFEIPFEITTDAIGNTANQIWYPSRDESVCDVICHKYSYGYECGLLEMMGLTTTEDDVDGYLTPEEVFERIWRHWQKNR